MDAAHLSENAARQQGWQLLSCLMFRPSTIASLAVYRHLGPWASCYLVPAVGLRHRLHVPESQHWDHGVTIATHPKRSRKSSRERHVRDNFT